MRKQKRTVRYEQDTLDQIEHVAGQMGLKEATLMRRLLTSTRSISHLYREWQRIEREVERLSTKPYSELEERHDNLMARLDDLSAAEEHLLDEIQAELRDRASSSSAETVPA